MSNTEKLAIAGLVLALATIAGGAGLRQLTRGVRNNNPGNIRRTGTQWRGEVPDSEKTDAEFEQFTAPQWGIRAIAKTLDTYRERHGLNTVQSIIERWAPGHENPTDAYVQFVSNRLGVPPRAPLAEFHYPALVSAIIEFEQGFMPYSAAVIEEGISLA